MKKLIFTLLALCFMSASLYAADSQRPRAVIKDVQKTRNGLLGGFTKGSVTSGAKATGSVRRWYLFNEFGVGSSYTELGQSQYVSADLSYSTYIRSIESVLGGMNFMIGTEVSVPLYLLPMGKSNILYQDIPTSDCTPSSCSHMPLETKENQGLAGFGIQLPLMIGLEYKGFYLTGLVGYTWLFMNDTYSASRGNLPTVETNYGGLIYGGGLGYKVSNIVNIGLRYTRGSLTNYLEGTKFSDTAVANGLDSRSITRLRGRDNYNIDYQKFSIFISIIL